MAYLSEQALRARGFRQLGRNVMISEDARIYRPELISIGDHVRIDDFCVVSGNVTLGSQIHLSIGAALLGGTVGIRMEDFTTLAHGALAFVNSDDYSGLSMTNSTVPEIYKPGRVQLPVLISRHSIVGARAMIMPGVTLAVGSAIGAMSMVTRDTQPWSIYIGVPARRIKARSQQLLELERQFLADSGGGQ